MLLAKVGANTGSKSVFAAKLDKYNSEFAEDFVGTGAIAIGPAPLIPARETRRKRDPEKPMAKPATTRRPPQPAARSASRYRKPLDEDLKGAGHQMDRIDGGGEGLADQTPTSDTTGERDTEFTEIGKEWPRDHNETEAMCDVDEDGTEHEPQGSHESKHGEADDGIQDKLGHNWPDEPKNSGGQFEEFGNHISGSEMKGWKGPKGEGVPNAHGDYGGSKPKPHSDSGSSSEASSDDSTEGVDEGWNPSYISGLMEDNVFDNSQLQQLFDLYARDTSQVTLEGFQELLDAHGIMNEVNPSVFIQLLDNNPEFMFHEMQDNIGRYWLAEGVPPEFKKNQFKKGGKKGSKKESDDGEEDDKPEFLKEGGLPAALKKHQFKKGGGKGGSDDDGEEGEDEEGDDDKPAFLKGKEKGKKGPPTDDEDDDDGKPPFLKEGGLPAALKKHQFGKGGKKGVEKECDEPMPKGKKKSMKECNKTCREWLDRAKGIHNALQEQKISPTVAQRAMQISLNMGLTRADLRGAPEQTRSAVAQVARSYKLSIDEGLQRLAEGFYDFQNRGTPGAGGMGGPPDPFGQAPLGEVGTADPNDPMAGQTMGMGMDDPEGELGGPVSAPGGGLGSPALGGGLGDPVAPGMEAELPGGMGAGAGGMPNDPAFGDLPPTGLDDDVDGMGEMMNGGLGDPGMDDYGITGPSDAAFGGQQGRIPPPPNPMDRQRPPMRQPPMNSNLMRTDSKQRSRRPISEDGHLPGGTTKGGVMKGAGHQMDHAGETGNSVASKTSNRDSGLPQDDTETTELKGKDLLGASQKNTVPADQSQEFEGGGKGKLGQETGLAENLTRLGRYVKRYLTEHDHGLRGQFNVAFNTKVDGKRASANGTLPDIMADAEELVLVYGNDRVVLEAVYTDRQGKVAHRVDVPLPRLNSRGATIADGKVLFRFNKVAEQFAQELVNEGTSCRITSHNWGSAVVTRLPAKSIHRAFKAVLK